MANPVYVEQLTKSLHLSLFLTMSRPYSAFNVEIRAGHQFHIMNRTSAPAENCLRLKNCLSSISLTGSVCQLLRPFRCLQVMRYPDPGWFSAKMGRDDFFKLRVIFKRALRCWQKCNFGWWIVCYLVKISCWMQIVTNTIISFRLSS